MKDHLRRLVDQAGSDVQPFLERQEEADLLSRDTAVKLLKR